MQQLCFLSGEILVTSADRPSDTLAKITSAKIGAQHKLCLQSSHMPSLSAFYSLFLQGWDEGLVQSKLEIPRGSRSSFHVCVGGTGGEGSGLRSRFALESLIYNIFRA